MGKLGQAPAMVPRQSGAQGTIVQQSVALQIRGEVLKSKEVVYKVTCSNVDDMDEVWRHTMGRISICICSSMLVSVLPASRRELIN